jgi:hypothetical protein
MKMDDLGQVVIPTLSVLLDSEFAGLQVPDVNIQG